MIIESWIVAAAAASTILAAISIAAKELMRNSSGLAYTYLYSLLAFTFYTPVFLYFLATETVSFTPLIILAILTSGLANIVAIITYNYSIKLGELSTVIPFTKLNPVFTGILAAIFLAETISYVNAAGIILVTLGSYVILKDNKDDLLDPIRRFKVSDAPKLGAASAFLYSIASIADRFVTQTVSPEIYTYLIYFFMTAGLTAYILARDREIFTEVRENFSQDRKLYSITGLGAAIASYLIFFSFSKAEASKVIPVLQLQVFISVLAGITLFNEGNIKEKIIGSVILVVGVAMTAI